MPTYLVAFGDKTILDQERAGGFRRFVDFVAGFLDRADFAFDFRNTALGEDGDHVRH